MRWTYLIISTLLLGLWLIFGNFAGAFGLPVPALGPFFNPSTGFWQNADDKLRHEADRLTFQIDHPLAEGEIFFDDRGVPHIFAADLEHACFLQGYVNAYDRMWQMDLTTRSTEGALAQVLGPAMKGRDRRQIRRGYREVARRTVDTMRQQFPTDYRMLQAYSDGINAYLDQLQPADYPVEYKLLGHTPQRWSPYRIALLMKEMSSGLSGRYSDAEATATRDYLGPKLFDALFPERFPGDDPIVPDATTPTPKKTTPPTPATTFSFFPSTDPVEDQLPSAPPHPRTRQADDTYRAFPPDPDIGSNNWAVAPARSNTDYPLLASDPHLRLTYPSVWYEVQLHFPGCNARGVGLAGAPGIMIGFNDYVAWGETNVGHDVTDWYRMSWTDDQQTAYLLDGQERPTNFINDTIRIKGEEPEIVRTPWTVFGPVPETEGPYAGLAMRWRAHDSPGKSERPHTMVQTFLQLMQAKNYEDYKDALRGYADPAQNFLFAARDGDIAIRPNGFFPLRKPGQGRFIQAGDSSKNNWSGVIPFDRRPVHYNPARGFVSSANQVTTGPKYPYYYVGSFDEYRGRYINRVLGRQPVMNQRRMKELQLDDYSLLAEELTPLLIARIDRKNLNEDGQRLLRVLSEWDYKFSGESRAPSLFNDWYSRLYRLTFDELPDDQDLLNPELWKWNNLLATEPRAKIFDIDSTSFTETAATLTQRAFDEILETLEGEMPHKWYEERNATIGHLGQIPGFGSPLIRSGGARRTPRVVDDGFGGSWRMVIELGPEARGWGALPGGASGNPGSEFYDIGFQEWADGLYHPLDRWTSSDQACGEAYAAWTFVK